MTQDEFQYRYKFDPKTDIIGAGSFGTVYKAYDQYLSRWVAIKKAEVKYGNEKLSLKHEVDLVKELPKHINIANYEECFRFTSYTGEYDFAILQYYELGNLQDLLSTKQLSGGQKVSILCQILDGIEFLHNKGIIHRDLKPQNILIAQNQNGDYIPKISDFGISKKIDNNNNSVFTNTLVGGTIAYASPEQLLGQTIKKNSDLWSFGVIICNVFLGKLPFDIGNNAITSEAGRQELYKNIAKGEIAQYVRQLPQNWFSLVEKCIVVDVNKRINNATKCQELLRGESTNVIDESLITKRNEDNRIKQETIAEKLEIEKEKRLEEMVERRYKRIQGEQKEIIRKENEKKEIEDRLAKENKFNKSYIWIILGVIGFVVWISFGKKNIILDNKYPPADSIATLLDTIPILDVVADSANVSGNLNTNSLKEESVTSSGIVTDIDGNVYKTIKIGNQVWMAENLKVNRYQNGDPITNVTDQNEWGNLTTGAWCNYENDIDNGVKYGYLYNWYAVSDYRNIAPKGWHVPTDSEWKILSDYLGGEKISGGKLKETGTTHWQNNNEGANNETGFSALPGGYRSYNGQNFTNLGSNAYWWCSNINTNNTNYGIDKQLSCYGNNLSGVSYYPLTAGISVRCLRN